MQNNALRVFMWLFGLTALIGNIIVIILKCKKETMNDTQQIQNIFTVNLAVSDTCMGIYMLFLAIADAYYGDKFYKYSNEWRVGYPCRMASFLVILTSETTLLLLVFTTADRFSRLVFPFSINHMETLSAIVSVVAIWCFTIPLSVLTSVFAAPDSDFYELSDVCIGLPFLTRGMGSFEMTSTNEAFDIPTPSDSMTASYFALVIFLALNLFLTCIIVTLYTIAFFAVRKSGRAAQQTPNIKQEMKMALRMSVVAVSNCMCWLPVIILSGLSQAGYISVSLDVYVWSVIFILPINASLNPIMYTS